MTAEQWTPGDTQDARAVLSDSRTAHYEHNELGADYDNEIRRLLSKALDTIDAQQRELTERDRMLDETQQGQVFRDMLGQIEGLGRGLAETQELIKIVRVVAHDDTVARMYPGLVDALSRYDALRGEESE